MRSNFNLSFQGHYASSRRQIYRQEALKDKRYRKVQEALEAMEEEEKEEDGSNHDNIGNYGNNIIDDDTNEPDPSTVFINDGLPAVRITIFNR